jgi:DASS family divalent anion:Na+ symporter
MFVTSMVANPLMVALARETAGIEITWAGWATAAVVPGLISLAALPYLVLRVTKPEIRETPEASDLARAELARLGPLSRDEWVVAGVFLLVFLLWMTGASTGLEPMVVAFVALCAMLIIGALEWDDVLAERAGWDALIWFGGLLGMATMLNRLGLIAWFATFVQTHIEGWPWLPALAILTLGYLYSHYVFATLTAHVTALFVPFLSVAITVGAPPYLAALILAFSTSLSISLTHYAGGPSAIYFAAGYSSVREWWTVGFLTSVLYVGVWMGIGPLWWKVLGLY